MLSLIRLNLLRTSKKGDLVGQWTTVHHLRFMKLKYFEKNKAIK